MARTLSLLNVVIRVLVIVAIVGLGLFIYQSCSGSALIQTIDRSLPDSSKAPFAVTTMTRAYLAQDAVFNSDGGVNMTGWYEMQGSKWKFDKGTITLLPVLKPRISGR